MFDIHLQRRLAQPDKVGRACNPAELTLLSPSRAIGSMPEPKPQTYQNPKEKKKKAALLSNLRTKNSDTILCAAFNNDIRHLTVFSRSSFQTGYLYCSQLALFCHSSRPCSRTSVHCRFMRTCSQPRCTPPNLYSQSAFQTATFNNSVSRQRSTRKTAQMATLAS